MASTGTAESPQDARKRAAGQWLREQREQRGWTGQQLADRVGVTRMTISSYERGRDKVSDERADDIARALGMNIITVRRGLRLWLPEGAEPPQITAEEGIRADRTLRPDQRGMLLAVLSTVRSQPSATDPPTPGGDAWDQTWDR